MVSLAEIIKFRNVTSQLSHQEAQELLNHVSNQHKDVVISALFLYFQKHSLSENTRSLIGDVTRWTSNIIEARDSDSANRNEKTDDETRKNMDQLPRALIGVTASFLRQKDLVRPLQSLKSRHLHWMQCALLLADTRAPTAAQLAFGQQRTSRPTALHARPAHDVSAVATVARKSSFASGRPAPPSRKLWLRLSRQVHH